MTIAQILARFKTESGLSDTDRAMWFLELAIAEVNVVGDHLLQELTLTPDVSGSTGVAVFTLPWQVRNIRAIRAAGINTRIELNSIHASYMDNTWEEASLTWTELARTPLDTALIKPSKLAFTKVGAEDTAVEISIAGPSTFAQLAGETFSLTSTYITEHSYRDISTIAKSIANDVDILVFDESDQQISFLPNFMLSADRIRVRVPFTGEVDVLYETYIPTILQATLPDGVSHAVIYKMLELANLEKLATADPSIYTEKAKLLYRGYRDGRVRGKTMRMPVKSSCDSLQGQV